MKLPRDVRYVDADLLTLTNNAIMYLFTNIKYSLGVTEIESVNHPGFATTMLSHVKYPPDFHQGSGLIQCWYPDSGTTAVQADNNGFALRQAYVRSITKIDLNIRQHKVKSK